MVRGCSDLKTKSERMADSTIKSIEWKTGSIIYMLSGDELIEDIKRNEY